MKIAITGATGFLGKRTAQVFADRGYSVTALGRNAGVGRELQASGLRFVACDLDDRETLTQVFRDQDAIVHCAALASPWGLWKDFYRSNVIGTRNVIDALRGSSVSRWVYISTPSIYIDGSSREDVRESDPIPEKGVNHYAESKRQAEELLDAAMAAGGIPPVVTLRPQGLFGPEDPQILPRLIRLGKKGKLPRVGEGRNRIDLTYVDNVVDAIECALLSGSETFGKKYNITNGEPVESYPALHSLLNELGYRVSPVQISKPIALAVATVLETFHRIFVPKKEPLLTRYSVGVLADSRTLNIDAARAELMYQPKVSVQEGLRRVIEWQRKTQPQDGSR